VLDAAECLGGGVPWPLRTPAGSVESVDCDCDEIFEQVHVSAFTDSGEEHHLVVDPDDDEHDRERDSIARSSLCDAVVAHVRERHLSG
jgi:hypothetical protein